MVSDERDLGDGLVLRWSTAADVDRLAACMGRAFGKPGEPDVSLEHLVRRYTGGDYPFMCPDDFALVEDTTAPERPAVAGACYLRETWSYAGIDVPVARPEIVGTDHGYRNRNLIRAVFDLLHERAAAEKTLLQGITGIPYFYRQFGYEYALDLGGGVRVPAALVPELPEGEQESCRLRRATAGDIDAIEACYRRDHDDSLMWLQMPRAYWHYLVTAEDDDRGIGGYHRVRVLETGGGQFRGYVVMPYERHGDSYGALMAGIVSGVDVQALAPSLLRALAAEATAVPARKPEEPIRTLTLGLGQQAPLMTVLRGKKGVAVDSPYAWYMRMPDVVAFLRQVAPALEARLAKSPLAGHCGDVVLTRYRDGIRLSFDHGTLTSVETVDPSSGETKPAAGFPPLVLTQLLLGYRSVAQLRGLYPDVWVNDEAEPLLDVVFPKRTSHVFGV